jgi:hypothetical protein
MVDPCIAMYGVRSIRNRDTLYICERSSGVNVKWERGYLSYQTGTVVRHGYWGEDASVSSVEINAWGLLDLLGVSQNPDDRVYPN